MKWKADKKRRKLISLKGVIGHSNFTVRVLTSIINNKKTIYCEV
jgi:hypothetical protein